MTRENAKANLPGWSKALIVLVAAGLLAIYGAGLMAIFHVKKVGLQSIDPVAIAGVAQQIGSFPAKLPDGYRYVIGISPAPGLDIVTIEHSPEKQLLTFISAHGANEDDVQHLLRQGYSFGLNMMTTSAVFTGIKGHGSVVVAKQQMPFIVGTTRDISKHAGIGMVGAVQIPVKEGKKNILIYALQTSDVPYNQQITMDLLNSIGSF